MDDRVDQPPLYEHPLFLLAAGGFAAWLLMRTAPRQSDPKVRFRKESPGSRIYHAELPGHGKIATLTPIGKTRRYKIRYVGDTMVQRVRSLSMAKDKVRSIADYWE